MPELTEENSAALDRYLGYTDEGEDTQDEASNEPVDEEETETADDVDTEGDDSEGDYEAEGDDSEYDESEASDEDSDEEGEAPFYADKEHKVKLDDGTETTVGELIRGNLREADYTRKNQVLAEQRKEFEGRHQKLQQNEHFLDLAMEIVLASVPEAPPQTLIHTNPIEYYQRKTLFENRLQELQGIIVAKKGLEEEKAISEQEHRGQVEIEQARLLADAMPELKDPKKRETFGASAVKAMEKYGFPPDIRQVEDHRFMLILRDLIEYQRIISNKPKAMEKIKGKPPLNPSNRKSVSDGRSGAMERLKKSGGTDKQAIFDLLDKYV